ncbi:DENND5A [Symbiodinium sp. CCMP2592]|nr:DENND5A [Symbiodinium sp. CCMP2592]
MAGGVSLSPGLRQAAMAEVVGGSSPAGGGVLAGNPAAALGRAATDDATDSFQSVPRSSFAICPPDLPEDASSVTGQASLYLGQGGRDGARPVELQLSSAPEGPEEMVHHLARLAQGRETDALGVLEDLLLDKAAGFDSEDEMRTSPRTAVETCTSSPVRGSYVASPQRTSAASRQVALSPKKGQASSSGA